MIFLFVEDPMTLPYRMKMDVPNWFFSVTARFIPEHDTHTENRVPDMKQSLSSRQ